MHCRREERKQVFPKLAMPQRGFGVSTGLRARTPGVSREGGNLVKAAPLSPQGATLHEGLLRRLLHCLLHPPPELLSVGLRGDGETLVTKVGRLRGRTLLLPLMSMRRVASQPACPLSGPSVRLSFLAP